MTQVVYLEVKFALLLHCNVKFIVIRYFGPLLKYEYLCCETDYQEVSTWAS